MEIPEYWLKRPLWNVLPHQPELERVFEKILARSGAWIDQPLPVEKWQFLCWLAETKGLLLHGSNHPDITEFEPRTPNAKDDDDFSRQTAVLASSDGIWSMFYAILDRTNFKLRMLNGALRFERDNHELSEMRYYFSITNHVLPKRPWREGVMYVLPREGFVQQPRYQMQNWTVDDPHWASLEPIKPLVKLLVKPEDFPFLSQIRGHDDAELMQRAAANPTGFPWLED